MSTSSTGSAQLQRLRSLGLSTLILEALRDIDTFDDALAVADLSTETRLAVVHGEPFLTTHETSPLAPGLPAQACARTFQPPPNQETPLCTTNRRVVLTVGLGLLSACGSSAPKAAPTAPAVTTSPVATTAGYRHDRRRCRCNDLGGDGGSAYRHEIRPDAQDRCNPRRDPGKIGTDQQSARGLPGQGAGGEGRVRAGQRLSGGGEAVPDRRPRSGLVRRAHRRSSPVADTRSYRLGAARHRHRFPFHLHREHRRGSPANFRSR